MDAYTAPNPGWANYPVTTCDRRKLICIGLLVPTFILHIVSGCIPQATTANGDTINLFSTYTGYDPVDTPVSCANSNLLVMATICFVAALLMLMACIVLMVLTLVRSFQPHVAVLAMLIKCVVALIGYPLLISLFEDEGNHCRNGSLHYTLSAGFTLSCFLPPLAVACIIPSYMMYKSNQVINHLRQLEMLIGGLPTEGSPSPMANSPTMYPQPNVMYASHQPNIVYMTSEGGVIYIQEPGVVYQQQPMMHELQQQPPMNETVVMGVAVPQQ